MKRSTVGRLLVVHGHRVLCPSSWLVNVCGSGPSLWGTPLPPPALPPCADPPSCPTDHVTLASRAACLPQDYQKGVDLIRDNYEWLMSEGAQLVFLGSGSLELEQALRDMENK